MIQADPGRESTHRQMLRYWWFPAAVSGLVTLLLVVVALTSGGLKELPNPWWFLAGLILMVFGYLVSGLVLLIQYLLDRKDATRQERAARRKVLSAAELRYLRGASRLEQRRLRARLVRGTLWKILGQTLLLPVTILLSMLLLGEQCRAISEVVPAGWVDAEWVDRIILLIVIAAVGVGILLWWVRVSGLRQDRFIVQAVVLELSGVEVKEVADVGLYATGATPAEVKVRIDKAWRLTSRGLEPATGANWTGERYLQRSHGLSAIVGIDEEVVLVCFDDGRVVGRLGDYLPVGAAIPVGIR
jgi:hypothetical protein